MKVMVFAPARAYKASSDEEVVTPDVLASLHDLTYEDDCCYKYLSMDLAAVGIIGGTIRCRFSAADGLELLTEYWSPRELSTAELAALKSDTIAQWDDGIGENGFRIRAGEDDVDVVPCAEVTLVSTEQEDDARNVPTPSAIAIGARNGDVLAVQRAIERGEDINHPLQEYAPLHLAILYGHVDIVLALLEHGAEPNRLDPAGDTPLHLCAASNSLSDDDSARIARALLSRGAARDTKSRSGETAACLAQIRNKMLLYHVLS